MERQDIQQKSVISLVDDELILDFPYDKNQVAEIKAIDGAKWDKIAKVWRVPAKSLTPVRDFAVKHGFVISDEILVFNTPMHKNPGDGITIKGNFVFLSFRYDPVMVRSVKQIEGITWDAKSKAWRAPLTSLDTAIKWATTFRQNVPEEVTVLAEKMRTELNVLLDASRSTDAELHIATLNGELLGYQRAGVAYASHARRTFIADEMGLGKLQAVSSLVLTPTGWVKMGDIKPGMFVTGQNGRPTEVTNVYPQGIKPLYRVTFNDGSSTLAGEEHLWTVRTPTVTKVDGEWFTVTTGQIIRKETLTRQNKNGRTYHMSLAISLANGNRRLQIPLVEPVHYENENDELPIDPYLLGCWLGDGSSLNGQITSMDDEIHYKFSDIYPAGRADKQENNRSTTTTYIGLRTLLRELGLIQNKHIPEKYLRSSPESRLAIIQGLMDTDGYAGKCHTEYSTSLKSLADGMVELVQSLGGIARVATRIPSYTYKGVKLKGKLSYRINVKLPSTMTPFRLQRKIDSYVRPTKYEPMRYIESIKYSHDEEAQCIAVDAPDHLYVTDEFIVTHNTIQAMATLESLHLLSETEDTAPCYPAVVVCPSSLVLNWKKEYNRFFPERIVEVVKDRKTIPMFGTYDVVVVGYPNITAWEKQLYNHNSYVFDESHYCKSPDAQRTKSAKKMTKSNKNAVVLCLTGTPVTNRPAEYAPQLDILGQLDKFGGLWGFYRRYCGAHKDKWGQWHLEGHSNLEELNEKLRSICYIRRTKDQVMTDLPPVVHAPITVEGSPAVMKEYAKAEADIVAYLIERAKQIAKELGLPIGAAAVSARLKAEANEHLVKMSVLRKIAARAKMPVVEEWIKERVDQGRKVVVAAHHRDIVDEITNRFGGLKIQGGMDVNDVEDAKHKFQTLPCDQAPVIVLSIQAAKTGHTLTASQEVLFVELPWTPADVDQTYSRCHRLGQLGSVTSTYMMTSGTIDEDIYALIEQKRKIVNVATEGDFVFDDNDASNIIFKLIEESLYMH